jgi:hypothetical protein
MKNLMLLLAFFGGGTGVWAQTEEIIRKFPQPGDVRYLTENWNAEGDSIEEIIDTSSIYLRFRCQCFDGNTDGLVLVTSEEEYRRRFAPSCYAHDSFCVKRDSPLPEIDFNEKSLGLIFPFRRPSPRHGRVEYRLGINHTKRHYYLEATAHWYGYTDTFSLKDGRKQASMVFVKVEALPLGITFLMPRVAYPDYDVKTIIKNVYEEYPDKRKLR